MSLERELACLRHSKGMPPRARRNQIVKSEEAGHDPRFAVNEMMISLLFCH